MTYKRSLFIFRQDLRTHDNTALIHAIKESEEIVPVFIFDKKLLESFPQHDQRQGFLVEALESLDAALQKLGSYLCIYYGDPVKLIPEIVVQHDADAIFHNRSYGTGSQIRDNKLSDWATKNNRAYHSFHDYLLVPISAVPQRKVFTPFFKLRQKELAKEEVIIHHAPKEICSPKIELPDKHEVYKKLSVGEKNIWQISDGKDRMHTFNFANYDETRNFPAMDGSSKMSPYSRFGLISIRELYKKAESENAQVYISELAWREFWHHIMFHFPETRYLEFLEKRRNLAWDNNIDFFNARKEGKTGYPMVDAGMRQLQTENWMHNRVRMVVASFLCKDLLIDRRWGEKHFRDFLLDYDENVNIGNRQRAASAGADPKPLRIFSPMRQSERFDKECEYIKRRIPELNDASAKEIHDPLSNDLSIYGYARPIVDHYVRSKKAKEMYKNE